MTTVSNEGPHENFTAAQPSLSVEEWIKAPMNGGPARAAMVQTETPLPPEPSRPSISREKAFSQTLKATDLVDLAGDSYLGEIGHELIGRAVDAETQRQIDLSNERRADVNRQHLEHRLKLDRMLEFSLSRPGVDVTHKVDHNAWARAQRENAEAERIVELALAAKELPVLDLTAHEFESGTTIIYTPWT
jgi:hypothetical protein